MILEQSAAQFQTDKQFAAPLVQAVSSSKVRLLLSCSGQKSGGTANGVRPYMPLGDLRTQLLYPSVRHLVLSL